jgi:hypothetical protein
MSKLPADYTPNFPEGLNTNNCEDEGDKYTNDANMVCRLAEHRCGLGVYLSVCVSVCVLLCVFVCLCVSLCECV